MAKKFGAGAISKGTIELGKVMGSDYPYLKVTLGRLVKRGVAFKIRRGVYFVPSPENVSKLMALRENPVLDKTIKSIYAEFNRGLKLALIYGSYARGDFDKRSDVDVLVVADGRAGDFAEKLGERLGLKVDLHIVSEPYFKRLMVVEPKVHFWLKEGILFDESGISKEVYPIGKIGVYESIRNVELQLEISREADDPSKRGYHLLVALREILTLKHALDLDFEYRNVKKELVGLAGGAAMEKLRRHGKAAVTRKELLLWGLLAEKLFLDLKRSYVRLGEGIGDIYMKKIVGRGHEQV